jgi:hypothetical protein
LLVASHRRCWSSKATIVTSERVDQLRRASKLPPGKTLDTFEEQRLPRPLCSKIREVATGAFVDRGDNVLIFGLPGQVLVQGTDLRPPSGRGRRSP